MNGYGPYVRAIMTDESGKPNNEVRGIGSFRYSAPFDNLVLIPDVSTSVDIGDTSAPSEPVKVIDYKKIAIYADMKDATDATLIFEISPTGVGSDWFLLEEKKLQNITDQNQFFVLASGDDVLTNYLRVSVKNEGASAITLPFVRAVMRG